MNFRFANPNWSHAWWLVLAVVALICWLDWRRGDVLSRFISTTMQARLAFRLSNLRRWFSIFCLGLSAAVLVVALMRPQWGLTYLVTPRAGAQIMVCLDVSKSMLAEDTAPNRLDRAKAEVTDVLSYLDGDQVGLIAFAGRATVLCPLTPDYGFFKLILDNAGPFSIGRGGTRLEEPVRKALAGFRTESDVARLLVLITDGEDHDSHPLDAAKAAAERGVKILAIGFGDEAGSEIYVTDPRTGARTQLRDAAGKPVISRLDGQTLREMALATDGAYIPAATGALDLKSIYDAHIAPLMRGDQDDRGHAVRREAFQWAVLVGLALLVLSVLLGSGSRPMEWASSTAHRRPLTDGVRASKATLIVISVCCLTGSGGKLPAQTIAPPGDPHAATSSAADGQMETSFTKNAAPSEEPRDVYNESLAYLEGDMERAEQLLVRARREAATDGDVRYRATYNLGWLEVNRADAILEEDPEQALSHLHRSADWFRDAVRLRPDDRDARHNLEIVLRRILWLTDSLAKTEERNLAQRLDELIAAQRGVVSEARTMIASVTEQRDPNAADLFRREFRQLSVQQRKVLSDTESVSKVAQQELDALLEQPDDERQPDVRVRAAQLSNLLEYTNRASQRLARARSQMRRRQAQRAFRRAAVGLEELKRAHDQLRNPVEILDVLIADAHSLAQLTSLKSSQTIGQISAPSMADAAPAKTFAWLTVEYLTDNLRSLMERTTELTTRLQAVLKGSPSPEAMTSAAQPHEATTGASQFVAMVREAMPFLLQGQQAFQSATQSVSADNLTEAVLEEMQAITALSAARERFLDLKGLIELVYAREIDIRRLLEVPDNTVSEPEDTDSPSVESTDVTEQMQTFHKWQTSNIERGERLESLLDENETALGNTQSAEETEQTQQQLAAQRQQFEYARRVLGMARDEMSNAADVLQRASRERNAAGEAEPSAMEETTNHISTAHGHADLAVGHLLELRRIFFSIVEHLRETAQRQASLNDQTEHVAALDTAVGQSDHVGPLSRRQQELRNITEQIAAALQEQAEKQSATPASDEDPQQVPQRHQVTQQYEQASKLVADGGSEMEDAVELLSPEQPAKMEDDEHNAETASLDSAVVQARAHQDAALQKLMEALAILQPPQPQQGNQDQPDQGDNQQQQQQEQQQQERQEQQAAGLDPARLLQAVRDRDAQRHRDREKRRRLERQPVDKDW